MAGFTEQQVMQGLSGVISTLVQAGVPAEQAKKLVQEGFNAGIRGGGGSSSGGGGGRSSSSTKAAGGLSIFWIVCILVVLAACGMLMMAGDPGACMNGAC